MKGFRVFRNHVIYRRFFTNFHVGHSIINRVRPSRLQRLNRKDVVRIFMNFLYALERKRARVLRATLHRQNGTISLQPLTRLRGTRVFRLLRQFRQASPNRIRSRSPRIDSNRLNRVSLATNSPRRLRQLRLHRHQGIKSVKVHPSPIATVLRLCREVRLYGNQRYTTLRAKRARGRRVFTFLRAYRVYGK